MSRAVANINTLLPETTVFNFSVSGVALVVDTPTRLVLNFGADSVAGIFGVEILGQNLSSATLAGTVASFRALAGDLATPFITYDQLGASFPLAALLTRSAPGPGPATYGFSTEEVFQGSNEVVGGQTRDLVNALEEADTVSGLGGDDVLKGGGGDDLLAGGAGADQLLGGDGDDTLTGGEGDDLLDGGGGVNQLIGGAGDDRFSAIPATSGGAFTQTVIGGEGVDRLIMNAPSIAAVVAPIVLD